MSLTITRSHLDAQTVQQYEDGFLIVRGVFTADEIATLDAAGGKINSKPGMSLRLFRIPYDSNSHTRRAPPTQSSPQCGEHHSNGSLRAVASFSRLLVLCDFYSITWEIQFQDHAVMNQAIDRGITSGKITQPPINSRPLSVITPIFFKTYKKETGSFWRAPQPDPPAGRLIQAAGGGSARHFSAGLFALGTLSRGAES